MKKLHLTSCLLVAFSVSVQVQAANNMTSHQAGRDACISIASACENAGYRLSKKMSGKNIWKDCLKPILNGKTISGVTADPTDVKNCKMHKEAWKKKHSDKM